MEQREVIGWFGAFIDLIAIIFNIKKNIWCWPLWLIGTSMLMYNVASHGDWATFSLFAVYQIFNVIGWITWAKEKKA